MADIFISYARDDRSRIEPLVGILENAGLSVWWDRELKGGARFSERIEEEVEKARAVIVAWSPASKKSRWVADEAELALQLNKLVPLSFDSTQAPMGFRQIHTIDYSDWSGEASASCVIELLGSIKGRDAAQPGHSSSDAPPAATVSDPAINTSREAEAQTIAVLPFVNMSSDPEQEYFSDGIAEELLNLLAKLEGLQVTARTSSFSLKGTDKQIGEIGELLGVAHVLEGSVRKAGNRVRITAQLIATNNGFHLWSETYDRTLDDIFAVQDEISAAIVEALRDHLLDKGPIDAPKTSRSANVDAYDHYLKGHFLIQGTTVDVIEKGLEELRTAIQLDPGFALAYADIGDAVSQLNSYGNYQDQAMLTEARNAAFTAVRLAPDLPEAHSAIASVHEFITLDWHAADAAYETAISLSSQSAVPYHRYAEFLWMTARLNKAREMAQRSIEIDPLNGNAMHAVGITSLMSGDFRTSAEAFGKWNALFPDNRWSYIKHGLALAFNGHCDASLDQAEKAYALSDDPMTPIMESWIAWSHWVCGRQDLYQTVRDRMKKELGAASDKNDIALFWIYALENDDEAVLKLLKGMARARHPHTCIARLPMLEHLRLPVTEKLKAREDYWDHLKSLDLPPSKWAKDPRDEATMA